MLYSVTLLGNSGVDGDLDASLGRAEPQGMRDLAHMAVHRTQRLHVPL